MKIKILGILLLLICANSSYSQVHIGDSTIADSTAVLDLTNSNNLGISLDTTLSGSLITLFSKPQGMLQYGGGYLFLSQKSNTIQWNALSPWIYKGYLDKGVSFPSKYGVGIRYTKPALSPYYANLHIGQDNKEVTAGSKSSILLIGDTSTVTTYKYMLFDNNEISVIRNDNTADTLKLQEINNGTVQVGVVGTSSSEVNVYGKVKENGGYVMPPGTVIMYYANWATETTKFSATGLGIGEMKGWAVCNGNNTTPNLNQRMMVGAGTKLKKQRTTSNTTVNNGNITYTQSAFGGHDYIEQASNEIGTHTHTAGTLSTSNNGNHNHSYRKTLGAENPPFVGATMGGGCNCAGDNVLSTTANALTTGAVGNHTHTITGSTANNSRTATLNNTPTYTTVTYLMKLN